MRTLPKKDLPPVVHKKTEYKETWVYEPIIGEVLGWWRRIYSQMLGETIEVHLNHQLDEYDRIIVNGQDITEYIKKPATPPQNN